MKIGAAGIVGNHSDGSGAIGSALPFPFSGAGRPCRLHSRFYRGTMP